VRPKRVEEGGDGELALPVDADVDDVLGVELEIEPRAAIRMTRAAKRYLPDAWVLPRSWSKSTPGERCIWLTITRSVPLTMNVPFFVISGMSPM
jgi:hypothetical protein